MRISTVREFRDNATVLLRSKDPILVTRRGKLAGIFFPRPETTLPIELKRELFSRVERSSGPPDQEAGTRRRRYPRRLRILAEEPA